MTPTTPRRPSSFQIADIQSLSRADLLKFALELGTDMDSIRSQLASAATKARETGAYAPRSWYAAAQHALRLKGRQLHQVYVRIGELKHRNTEFYRAFYELARDEIAPPEFDRLTSVVNDILKDRSGR